MLETSYGIFKVLEIFTVLETSLEGFSRCWRLLLEIFRVREVSSGNFFGGIFTVLETSEFFRGDGDFFGGIFTVLEASLDGISFCWRLLLDIFTVLETSRISTVLEISSGIFTVLETFSEYFFGGIFMVLETSLGNFQSWRLLEIFTVLETSLEGFSRCWRLL